MLADNNANGTQVTELPAGYSLRTSREWKVDKTVNFTQTVNMKFSGYNAMWKLVRDSDGDFSSGAVEVGSLNSNGEIVGVNLADGEYMTLVRFLPAPG